jgi:Tfp pilus assembly protein PilF
VLFRDLKQYEKARDDLSKVIENQKKPGTMSTWLAKNAYLKRASVYQALAQPDLARKDLKQAAQIKLTHEISEEP